MVSKFKKNLLKLHNKNEFQSHCKIMLWEKKNQNEIYDGVLIMDMISLITFL